MASMTPPGGQNLFGASDDFSEFPGILDRIFGNSEKGMKRIVTLSDTLVKNVEKVRKELDAALGNKGVGGQRLGLGSFTRPQQVGMGVAAGLAVTGGLAYSMAPNTMAAVTQRMYADSLAGLSGMGAQGLIAQSNRLVGGGATSAMGPTAAAATLAYSGGYLANTLSSKRVMAQLGGLSAITGGSNEQMAQAMSGINAMTFLKGGIRARDAQGNLVAPNVLINQVYRFLYGGRKVTKEQAMMVLNPGSKGYATIMQLTGGDPNLFQTVAMGVIARASQGGKPLTANQMSDPNKMLDVMGVGKESPIRSNFRYNTSEARKLQATEGGLVGGYNVALRTTASVNDGFSALAETLPAVTQALMTFKGALQTFPNAGNTGATLSGLGGMVAGMGMNIGQMMLAGYGLKKLGVIGGAGKAGGFLSKFGKFGKFAGRLPYVGIPITIASVAASLFGQGGGDCGHGNIGPHSCGMGGDSGGGSSSSPSAQATLQMPVPPGTRVTSEFGPRPEAAKRNPGISSNHSGIDYGVPVGTRIVSAGDGVVTETGTHRQYGNYIIIRHGKKSTLYGHLSKFLVSKGNKVKQGQQIALSGGKKGAPGAGSSTGPHLHFEVRDNGGVGAQGRVNPKGLFGKAFSFIKNLVSSGINLAKRAFGMDSAKRDQSENKNSLKNIFDFSDRNQSASSRLSTPSIAALLSELDGDPTSYEDVMKRLSPEDRRSAEKNGLFNNSYDEGMTGEKGIAGGSRTNFMRLLHAKGFRGKSLHTAFAVALAESGGRVDAVGDTHLTDKKWGPSYGPFQIRSLKDWKKYNDPYRDARRLRNGNFNVEAAYVKSNQGNSWKPWTTYTKGTYLKYLDDAQVAAQNAGIGGGDPIGAPTAVASGVASMQPKMEEKKNVNVTVQMNVTIARASLAEANHLVKEVKKSLEKEFKYDGMGIY